VIFHEPLSPWSLAGQELGRTLYLRA
jgi:hypothetical protein